MAERVCAPPAERQCAAKKSKREDAMEGCLGPNLTYYPDVLLDRVCPLHYPPWSILSGRPKACLSARLTPNLASNFPLFNTQSYSPPALWVRYISVLLR